MTILLVLMGVWETYWWLDFRKIANIFLPNARICESWDAGKLYEELANTHFWSAIWFFGIAYWSYNLVGWGV